MNSIQLKKTSDNYFQEAWSLYEDAFPVEERRSIEAQEIIMNNSNYHFDILTENDSFIGFILWWEFENHRYIDHFATLKQLRNKGYGKLILEEFMNKNKKPIILEVELPDSEINKRRVKFYQRIGLILNNHHYEVPSSEKRELPLELLLMSYPNSLSAKDVELFIADCHPAVFGHAKK